MLALVDDGLTEAVPNKGFQTVPLTPADLAETYEMRAGFDDMEKEGFTDERLPGYR